MKKIISVAMVTIILTIFSIATYTMYSGNKQINTANNVFDNTIALLKSRNFSVVAINEVTNRKTEQSQFIITTEAQNHYYVEMKYTLKLFGNKENKSIESDIYIAR